MERPHVIVLVIGENGIKQDTVPSVLANELVEKCEDLTKMGWRVQSTYKYIFSKVL